MQGNWDLKVRVTSQTRDRTDGSTVDTFAKEPVFRIPLSPDQGMG